MQEIKTHKHGMRTSLILNAKISSNMSQRDGQTHSTCYAQFNASICCVQMLGLIWRDLFQ